MADLHKSVLELQSYLTIATDVSRALEQAGTWISQAVAELDSVDDPAAREAAFLAKLAHDDVFQVIYGWLNDLIRMGNALIRSIES